MLYLTYNLEMEMMRLSNVIVWEFPVPLSKVASRPVEAISERESKIVADMARLVYATGLVAVSVGVGPHIMHALSPIASASYEFVSGLLI